VRFRFAFAGFDHWYNAFPTLESLLREDDVEVVALAHADPAQAADVAARYGRACSTSYDEIIERGDIDVVCCFTSTEQNAPLAIRALESGKHVMAIKPLALTLAEADTLTATVARAGRHYFPNDAARRFFPANVQFREWIDDGRIGDVISAHCVFRAGLPSAWPGSKEPGWFADPLRAPGGAFIDHAVYHIDVLRWLFGAGVARVTGTTANLRHKDIAVEDYGHGIFQFTNGCVGTIEDTWTSNPAMMREAIEIVGTRGSLIMDSATGKMAITGDFGLPDWALLPPPRALNGLIRNVIATLKGDERPVSTAEFARDNLAACLAFYESARTGQAVAPEESPAT
jgi:predicted dehydrogenase